MNQHHLRPLFALESVAIFGASNRADSVGQIVFQNILQNGYQGALYPINPVHTEIQGCKAYSSITQISDPVELVVIATPVKSGPDIVEGCGKRNVKTACRGDRNTIDHSAVFRCQLMIALMNAARSKGMHSVIMSAC
ncbi:CoA-binding protein [Nitrosomonas mobilis]|uniref:CoA-binding domain-containing protein n=1 Tax=Nitrosomonas mobilis TaxID=51642 RepID=A0A1G5SBH0_9PROT|nr:CoA-binding protein [Nitrosomonas mobilis]SCZ84448.1 hypothetical protein NSMM_160038 [Nitrosomonas mobilis]